MDDDYMSDEDYMRLEYYLEIGAIEIEGVDEKGELMFSISESAKEVAPELWQAHSDYVNRSLMELYKKDLIEVEYDENLEPTFNVTPEAAKIIKEMGLFPIDRDEE